jgi:hypothetical protein
MNEATNIPFSFCLRLLKQKLSWRHFNTNVEVQCKHEWHCCLSGWLQTVTARIWIILQHIGTHVVSMKVDMPSLICKSILTKNCNILFEHPSYYCTLCIKNIHTNLGILVYETWAEMGK